MQPLPSTVIWGMTSQTAESHSFWRRTHKALPPKWCFGKHEKISFDIENKFCKNYSLSHMGLAGLMTLTSTCFIIGHSCSIWMLHSHFQIFRYPLTIKALKVNFRSILKNRNMGMSEIFQLSVSSLKHKADNQYTWRVHYLSCTWMPSHIAAVKWGDSFVRK